MNVRDVMREWMTLMGLDSDEIEIQIAMYTDDELNLEAELENLEAVKRLQDRLR